MNILQAVCILCVGISLATSGPVPENSFYDEIVKKCPSVKSQANYSSQPLFQFCNNWKKISVVQTDVAKVSKVDVQCLLYFYAFTKYCEKVGDKVNTTVDTSKLEHGKFNVICDKKEFPPLLENSSLYKGLENETFCKQICGDEVGFVASLCSLAHYYNHLASEVDPHFHHVGKDDATLAPNTGVKVVDKSVDKLKETANKPKEADAVPVPAPADPFHENTNTEVQEKETTVPSSIAEDSAPMRKIEDVNIKPAPVEPEPEPKHPVKPPQTIKDSQDLISTKKNKPDDSVKPPPITEEAKPKQPAKPPLVDDALDTNQIAEMGPNEQAQDNDFNESEEEADNTGLEPPASEDKNDKSLKPSETDDDNPLTYSTEMEGDSYFFTYFMLLCIFFVVGYVCYHNKQKILALILEGRRGKRQYRGKRPNSANYHKLDSNLEEAINSTVNKNTNNVIY